MELTVCVCSQGSMAVRPKACQGTWLAACLLMGRGRPWCPLIKEHHHGRPWAWGLLSCHREVASEAPNQPPVFNRFGDSSLFSSRAVYLVAKLPVTVNVNSTCACERKKKNWGQRKKNEKKKKNVTKHGTFAFEKQKTTKKGNQSIFFSSAPDGICCCKIILCVCVWLFLSPSYVPFRFLEV